MPRTPDELRELVEAYLGELALTPELGTLEEPVRDALGGKRVRPVLTLAAAEAVGAEADEALAAAAAVELVHSFSLVHDDLPALDNDAERRGRPSVWAAHGEATAILAGDALLAEAFRLALRYERPTVARELVEATLAMIGGQQRDLEGGHDLAELHRLKTGALFTAAVMCGLWAAAVPADEHGPWRAFAGELGLLFQVVDDILDGDGYAEELGAERARRLADAAAGRALARVGQIDADTTVLEEIVAGLAAPDVVSPRKRLDLLLVERGLAASRSQAQALVMAGLVPGHSKPGEQVDEETTLEIERPPPYVSRAGQKLAYALDAFGVDPAGLDCLDIGASTGGFSDVLLQRGAARVIALDVGHGQLHPRVRADPRVIVLERTNARTLSQLPFPPRLVVCDVSFISVELAMPPALRLAAPGWQALALVKPQFEAGRGEAPKGVVRDAAVQRRVLRTVAEASLAWEARVAGIVDSGLPGAKGNREFVLHLVHAEQPRLPDELERWIADATG